MTRESPFCKRDEIADSPTHLSQAFLTQGRHTHLLGSVWCFRNHGLVGQAQLFQHGLNLPTPPAVGRRVQYDDGLSQLVPTNGERSFGGDVMATERTDEGRRHQRQDGAPSGGGTQGGGNADSGPPQPDMMPGLWMSWMERYFETPRPSPPRHPEFDIKKSMLKSLGTLSYSLEI